MGDFGGGGDRAVQTSEFLTSRGPRHRDHRVDRTGGADHAYDFRVLRRLHQLADLGLEMLLETAALRNCRRIVGEEMLGETRRAKLHAAHP